MEKQRENSTSSSKESSVEKQTVEGYSKTPETELEDETLIGKSNFTLLDSNSKKVS